MRAQTHLIHGLKCLPEGTLPKPWLREIRFQQQVRVAEYQLRVLALSMLLGHGEACTVWSADDTTRLEDVTQDLDIESPVAWVMKDGPRRRLVEKTMQKKEIVSHQILANTAVSFFIQLPSYSSSCDALWAIPKSTESQVHAFISPKK